MTPRLHFFLLNPVFVLMLSISLLGGCDSGPSSLPPEERPIPASAPLSERETLRKLPFQGSENFRDLGGYKTINGRAVKWGLIYRSDNLSELTPNDTLYLERLGLKRIVDFRSIKEREAAPDRIAPDSPITIEPVPITIAAADREFIETQLKAGTLQMHELPDMLITANRELVEQYTLIYRAWIQSILEPNGLPMLFHCTAGKDRTGFGAAIVLAALKVPMETIMADYMATNTYTADSINKTLTIVNLSSFFQADTEPLRSVLGVDKRFIKEAFKTIDKYYGSIDNYLEIGLGLTPAKQKQLQELLLEPL